MPCNTKTCTFHLKRKIWSAFELSGPFGLITVFDLMTFKLIDLGRLDLGHFGLILEWIESSNRLNDRNWY